MQKRLRREFVVWIDTMGPTHALTLNSDRQLSANRMATIFSLFCRKIDEAAFGRNFHRLSSSDRFQAIAIPENLTTNAHLHVAADLSLLESRAAKSRLEPHEIVRRAWLQSTRGAGSVDVKEYDDKGWVEYMTKRPSGTERLFWHSTDFHPR